MPKRKAGNKTSPLRQTSGFLFLILGLFLLWNLVDINWTKYQNQKLAENPTLKGEPINTSEFLGFSEDKSNIPQRIVIPNEQIDLKVVEAPIVNGYWETSDVNASHGEGSATPGQNGNIVIFAHARIGLFYNLKDVKLGDTIYVFTKDKWYQYKVNKITSVYPNDIKVISPTKSEELTLYTCSGFADEKRLIVQAIPVT